MKKLVTNPIMLIIFLLIPCFAGAATCNISISITSGSEIFENNEKIEFYNKLNDNSFEYIIEYWVEDSNGSIIKQKRNTTNQDKKSFTPKNLSTDIIIKSRIAYLGCDDASLDDNSAEKRVLLDRQDNNATHRTVKVSFIVNRDIEKLRRFANQLELGGNSGNNESLKSSEYKTKQDQTEIKKAIPYFLVTLTTLISIVLIWRR